MGSSESPELRTLLAGDCFSLLVIRNGNKTILANLETKFAKPMTHSKNIIIAYNKTRKF